MRNQISMFIGLVIAMIVLLAFAWYTWPTNSVQPTFVSPMSTSTSAVATTMSATTTQTEAASATASVYPPSSLGEGQGIVMLGSKRVYVDLAENPAQQELGLGNRASLGADQGMLFIFPNNTRHMFWMKDMSFSIDMIWFSDDGTVIYIQPNVAPSTYPDAFGPNQNSRYVLEVPANYAVENGITAGNKAALP